MKKQFALVLCLLLFLSACHKQPHEIKDAEGKDLSPVATASVIVDGVSAPEGYTAVASNENFSLFADKKTGDFAVWDAKNQQFTFSGRREVLDPENPIGEMNIGKVKTELVSMLTVHFVQVSTIASTAAPFSENSYAFSVKKNGVQVETIQNGYRATFAFSDIGGKVPVEITLREDGIAARIVGKGVTVGEDYRITSIDLLPGFMAGYEQEDGYLFVPSGSGALVPLNSGRGETAVYRETVYGDDRSVPVDEYKSETRQIAVPVYGVKEGNRAVFAVITKGDASSEIEVAASSPRTCFSRIFSSYITAVTDSTTLFESNFENQRIIYGVENRKTTGDYEVQYHFLSGENADWVGMASLYREQLALEKNPKSPELMLTLYGAAERKATFLGIPYTKSFALTSFSDAKDILSDLDQSGVAVSLRYVGWNDAGVRNKKIPLSFSPAGVLGGKSGLRKLTENLSGTATAYLDVDLMVLRESGRGYSQYSDVCTSIFGTRTPIYSFMRSTYVPVNNQNPAYLLTPGNTVTAAEQFLKSADKTEGLSLGDLGSVLYSDFSQKQGRESCLIDFKELLKKAADSHPLAFDTANAYAFPYADRICSIPMTSDGNILFSEDVPFLQFLLHGSVSYAAENGTALTDCIAYGADPQLVAIAGDDSDLMETDYNWLYGATYQNQSGKAKDAFKQYREVYKTLYKASMVGFSRNGDCTRTVFDTGDAVLVNHGKTAATVDGVTIEPGGFTVVKEADAS